MHRLGADIILIQETHFKTPKDMKEAFFPYGGQLRGYSPSASRSKGVVAYIPPDSVLYNMVHNVENDLEGRWALMEIRAGEEMQQLLNVYAPSSSTQARETFFAGLQGKFDECPNLIVAGDWNYAPEIKDRVGINGLVAPPQQPEADSLLLELGLVDLFRFTYPDAVAMTFRHRNKLTWARLDRWYVNSLRLHDTDVLDTVSAAGVSDHDAVGFRYGSPEERIERKYSMYRMSFSFIRQLGIRGSKVRRDIEETLRSAREEAGIAASLGKVLSPGQQWDSVKKDIHEYARGL